MKMTQNDSELLRLYVADRSETAFAELVSRHIDMAYSSALRQVNGDTHFAEDVTQEVFQNLVRKAAHLTRHPSLAGWLYLNIRFAASNLRREEHRRLAREQEAYSMNKILQADDPSRSGKNCVR